MKTLEFKASPGFGRWKKYYPKDATAHPAKINQNLLQYLIQTYTKEGEIVVDPMAGSGSTGVMCALNGRNCISVELEEKFWRWMEIARENVENTPQLTPKGKIINICGDSRRLNELLKEHEEEISSVLFSPPYASSFKSNPQNREKRIERLRKVDEAGVKRGAKWGLCSDDALKRLADRQDLGYGDGEGNIGNLPFADITIFSPPYTSAGTKADENPENYIRRAKERYELMKQQGINRPETEPGRYSGSWENIGNLPFSADCIVTSPPYSVGHDSGDNASRDYKERLDEQRKHTRVYGMRNIANLPFPLLDMILFSPPYSSRSEHRIGYDYQARDIERGYKPYHGFREQYENNSENIGSLKFGAILFSPPYSESLNEKKNTASNLRREERLRTKGHLPQDFMGGIARDCQLEDGMRYSNDENNIGNLKHGEIDEVADACLFSPPYHTQKVGGEADENAMAERWDKVAAERNWNTWGKTWTTEGRLRALKSMGSGYSEDKNNIGNIKEFGVSAAIFSPPYEESLGVKHHSPRADALAAEKGNPTTYTGSPCKENIGNLKSTEEEYFDEGKPLSKKHAKANGKETYLQAMKAVYGECHKILRKDGLMILILKNFIRQKRLVPLTDHTIKLCESCGFTLKERLLFKLPQMSFWRVLGKKQWEAEGREYPKDLSYEHILIFKKVSGG